MKKLSLLSAIFGLSFVGSAFATDMTVYYSPSCPHCHHAREFVESTLVYEYPELQVTMVNVTMPENQQKFVEALKKCEFSSGGVPVLVIGDKCEQGYADFMQDALRGHIEAGMTDEQKAAAAANKKAMETDAEKFKSENSARAQSIKEYIAGKTDADAQAEPAPDAAATADTTEPATAQAAPAKPAQNGGVMWFWGLLIVLVAGLGYVLVRKDKKK